jgi:hypothetical protein
MKNTCRFKIIAFLPLCLGLACGKDKPGPQKTVAEKLQKVWKAASVKHNESSVYTEGAASNTVAGYANFRLDLSNGSNVQLTEFEGSTFSGQWELNSTNTVLILKNLSPAPGGTNGTIEYRIDKAEDDKLELTRTTTSPKTGNSTNQYYLAVM